MEKQMATKNFKEILNFYKICYKNINTRLEEDPTPETDIRFTHLNG